MLVTLNNGNTTEISVEQYFSMNDREWSYFLDSEYGEEINDPFFHSQIHNHSAHTDLSDDDIIMDSD